MLTAQAYITEHLMLPVPIFLVSLLMYFLAVVSLYTIFASKKQVMNNKKKKIYVPFCFYVV